MSAECTSYMNADKVLVSAFSCPREDGQASAIYCCGFQDVKYCCDDPNSFFPYEHNYMWWLRCECPQNKQIRTVFSSPASKESTQLNSFFILSAR
ncbi:protein shisa-like-2A isoform X7 [Hemicordylus capensis]|uniref:protein shisa-like-2A isoform X7 n=1 Tax=Hemicordylus capensis TaxID=884348 RepID=UPI002302C127|nr:protein shisa-like-2A isoform X7 [Hemicordylus capensis]